MTRFVRRLSIYIYTALAAAPLWCGPAQSAPPVAESLRVAICHRPPGNFGNAHTLFVSPDAVRAHLSHGDILGPCGATEGQPDTDQTVPSGQTTADPPSDSGQELDTPGTFDKEDDDRGSGGESEAHEHFPPAPVSTGRTWFVNDAGREADSYTYSAGNDETGEGSRNRPYRTIGKASSAVEAGDTIFVDAGLYTEDVRMNKDTITLVGADPFSTVIRPNGLNAIHASSCAGLLIKNFRLDKTSNAILGWHVKDSRIDGVAVKRIGHGIYLYDCERVVIKNIVSMTTPAGDGVLQTSTSGSTSGSFSNIETLGTQDTQLGGSTETAGGDFFAGTIIESSVVSSVAVTIVSDSSAPTTISTLTTVFPIPGGETGSVGGVDVSIESEQGSLSGGDVGSAESAMPAQVTSLSSTATPSTVSSNLSTTFFTPVSELMGVDSGVFNSSIQWGDMDNDGDLDLAVSGDIATGYSPSINRPRLIIYRNEFHSELNIQPTGAIGGPVVSSDPETNSISVPPVPPSFGSAPPAPQEPMSPTSAGSAPPVPQEPGSETSVDTAVTLPQDTTIPDLTATSPSDPTPTVISEIPPVDTIPVASEPLPTKWLPLPKNLTAICHRPPGNPDKSRTIFVSSHAVKAHMAHGDLMGLCANANAATSGVTEAVTAGKTNLARGFLVEGKERWSLKVEIKHEGSRPSLTTLSKKLPPGIHRIREAKLTGGRIELIARPDGLYLQLIDVPIEPTDTAELEIILEMDVTALSVEERDKAGETWREESWGVEDKPAEGLAEPDRRVQGKFSGPATEVTIDIFDVTQFPPNKIASIRADSAGFFEFGAIPAGIREIVVRISTSDAGRIEFPNSIPVFRRVTIGEEKTVRFIGTIEPEIIIANEDADEIRRRVDRPDERQELSRGVGINRSRIDIPARALDRKFHLVMREPKNLARIEAAAKARGERLLSATEIILIDDETGEEIHHGFKIPIRIAFSLGNLHPRESAKVSHFDPSTLKLADVSSAVDPAKGEVAADVEHFSIYASLGIPGATAAPAYTDFSQLIVYPNPYEARYGTDRVFFENVPSGAELTIYAVGGQIVQEIPNDGAGDLNGSVRGTSAASHIGWGLTNRHGRPVAGAMYLFVLRDAAGNVKTGRVAVVR